jgi:membrane protein
MESVIHRTHTYGLAAARTWGTLARRTLKESWDDDVLGLAAQLSYYFFLSLFPAMLVLLAFASFFPLAMLADDLGRLLRPFVSPAVIDIIQEQMRRLGNAESTGILSLGLLGALWSSSAALVSIVNALNRAYDIIDHRAWWKVRIRAIVLTLALAVFMLRALSLILTGPSAAAYLGNLIGWGAPFKWAWLVLQWPLAIVLVSSAIAMVYYFGPDARQNWVRVAPGAIVATSLWLLISMGFKAYVGRFTDFNASYGAVGGVIVVLLWLYVSGIAILVGAELNAEIEMISREREALAKQVAMPKRVAPIPRVGRPFVERYEKKHEGDPQPLH